MKRIMPQRLMSDAIERNMLMSKCLLGFFHGRLVVTPHAVQPPSRVEDS